NPSLIQRAGAFPSFIEKLFGGRSLPFLDADVHLVRKEIVLHAFTPSALESYLPAMQRIVEETLQRWSALDTFKCVDRSKQLAFQVICANMLGMGPGPELQQLQSDYETVSLGLVSLPIPIPGTRYWKALEARKRIFATLKPILNERRQSQTTDGVSRILSGTSGDGTALTLDEVLLETHHAIIAGFIIFADMVCAISYANAHSVVREQILEEIKSVPRGTTVSLEQLGKLRYLGQFVMEVKRLCPIIPAVFGRAKKDFEVYGVTVPAGWLVLWAVRSTNIFRDSFADRMRFDPGRFDAPPENPLAFVPQGGGPPTGHRCAGLDYSTSLLEIFTIALLRDYVIHLSKPDEHHENYNWELNPPQPKDGLLATLSPIAG